MTPDELREKRQELETNIRNLIDTFQSETGFAVKSIRFDSYDTRIAGRNNRLSLSAVECEISLG